MSVKLSLFSQIIKRLDRSDLNRLVTKHQSGKGCKGFDSWTHLISMLFCHIGKSCSVRDISNGMRSATGNLNHLGVSRSPSKSSLSYQNKRSSSDLFRDYYFLLLTRLGQQLKLSRSKLCTKAAVHLLDSTTISLCLSLFDWAHFRTTKAAVKMHALLDYDGGLPLYVNITDGKTADDKGAVIVADRYYNDFPMLNLWDSIGAYFVLRHKDNLKFERIKERELPEKGKQHLLIDEEIKLSNKDSQTKYPKKLRRIAVWNDEHQMTVELITNNSNWSDDPQPSSKWDDWQVYDKGFGMESAKKYLHAQAIRIGYKPSEVVTVEL